MWTTPPWGSLGALLGRELEGRLLNDGINSDFTHVSGETRTNIILHESSTGKQLSFNAQGPEVQPNELIQLVETIEALRTPEIVAIGGNLPQGVSPEIYRKIITTARNLKARTVLDVDGIGLKVGLQAQPNIIKPNIHELSDLVGRELEDLDEILEAARDINKRGVEIVLVSMGARGILLVNEGQEYLAVPPQHQVRNTIGAGDSSVAGFIFGLISGTSLHVALAYAAAAGTVIIQSQGTALCQKKDFEEILPQMKVEAVGISKKGSKGS